MKKAFVMERIEEVLGDLSHAEEDLIYGECDCGLPNCTSSTLTIPFLSSFSIKELTALSNIYFVEDVRVDCVVPKDEEEELLCGIFALHISFYERIEDWNGEYSQQIIFEAGN